jgi:hypothetical protein
VFKGPTASLRFTNLATIPHRVPWTAHPSIPDVRSKHMNKPTRRLLKRAYPLYRPLLTLTGLLEIMARGRGTDKIGHGYIEYYRRYFGDLRFRKIKLLEIGIGGDGLTQGGASLRMWKDYFPRGLIFGIDIQDKRSLDQSRIKTFRGSQDDSTFLSEIAGLHGPFDVVIDDGSHESKHIITSFNALFPHVTEKGFYVIEDLFFSYHPSFFDRSKDLDSERTSVGMLKALVDDMHFKYIVDRKPERFGDRIREIAFFPKVCFIRKGDNSGRDAVVDDHFAFLDRLRQGAPLPASASSSLVTP